MSFFARGDEAKRVRQWLPATLLLILPWVYGQGAAKSCEFASGAQQNSLLELYTSEGCNSCPPADNWISALQTNNQLWKRVVPVAFHVDYWDYLGWRDPFASQSYSRRQRLYRGLGFASAVYTPGFFLNGREYRGWRFRNLINAGSGKNVGTLKVNYNDSVRIRFAPAQKRTGGYRFHVAELGMNLKSNVRAGENEGRELKHSFVVLSFNSVNADSNNASTIKLPNGFSKRASALAVWVTHGSDPTPIQVTGNWLNKKTCVASR